MKGKRISAGNRLKLEEIRIHDCWFTGFQYSYDQRRLFIKGWHVHERREVNLTFHGVIDVSMQACGFWGGGSSILCLYNGGKERLERLLDHAKQDPQLDQSKLLKPDDILCAKMELNSGDELIILCEYLFVGERELQLANLIMPAGQKSIWSACAYALRYESDTALLPHLSALFSWLQDMNWPGAAQIAERISQMSPSLVLPAYEEAIRRAQCDQDDEWLENLRQFAEMMNNSAELDR